jgi:nascent polypeptide-associated complex subunit beta
VNLFREDDHVIHFSNPKLQAAIQANTFIVSGNAETKTLEELLPGISAQVGHEKLRQIAERLQGLSGKSAGAAPAAAAADDDDVPALVGANFEATAAADAKKSNVNEQD